MARLLDKAIPEPTSGCWIWEGTRDPGGYGRIRDGRRYRLAHRVAWELAFGPIPDGFAVCHRCDNRACINLTHLFLGTLTDNNRDRMRKGRSSVGARHSERIIEGLSRRLELGQETA
jgi:hypothetical protein